MKSQKNGKPVIRLYRGQHNLLFVFRKTDSGVLQVSLVYDGFLLSWSNVDCQSNTTYTRMLEIMGETK